jgi:hypothetical protein
MTSTFNINGNNVKIEKKYRTRTQFEYYLTIFISESTYESILIYTKMHLTLRSAKNEAIRAITSPKRPFVKKII